MYSGFAFSDAINGFMREKGAVLNMSELTQLQQWVFDARRIVFFGGAGVSTESGIPDFRSVDGLYRQNYDVPPETILSRDYFARQPESFYRFYKEKMLLLNKRPNPAHEALVRLERAGRLIAVITQNIDGLHQMAGSRNVLELHGSVHRNACLTCGRRFDAAYVQRSDGAPRCPCGGLIKPDVVLYGETLDDAVVRRSIQAIRQADLLMVGGTSLTVYPAAGLIGYREGGCKLALLNRTPTPYDGEADLVLHGSIGDILGALRV